MVRGINMSKIRRIIMPAIPNYIKDTAFIRLFGFAKIPMLWFLKPTVVSLDRSVCEIKIPLTRKSKNHLNSMYFGALCCGADLAAGFMAMKEIQASGKKIALSFKSMNANFYKRAESTVHFKNTQGKEISKFVQEVIDSGERMEKVMTVEATCPKKLGKELVAKFDLVLSLKCK